MAVSYMEGEIARIQGALARCEEALREGSGVAKQLKDEIAGHQNALTYHQHCLAYSLKNAASAKKSRPRPVDSKKELRQAQETLQERRSDLASCNENEDGGLSFLALQEEVNVWERKVANLKADLEAKPKAKKQKRAL